MCTVVKCLHNQRRVNTYAIGIGRADLEELQCIIDDDINQGDFHLFNFDSFDDFENVLNDIFVILSMGLGDESGDPFVCVDPQDILGTDGCFFV